jgi:hypothetical protein
VSIAGYNQTLVEAPKINRIRDAVELFKSICDNQLLKKSNMILLLNKKDLFIKKILKYPLADYFEEFNADGTFLKCSYQ